MHLQGGRWGLPGSGGPRNGDVRMQPPPWARGGTELGVHEQVDSSYMCTQTDVLGQSFLNSKRLKIACTGIGRALFAES